MLTDNDRLLKILDALPVTPNNGWIPIKGYACRQCHGPAYRHPTIKDCWGCSCCGKPDWGMASCSISVYFGPLEELHGQPLHKEPSS